MTGVKWLDNLARAIRSVSSKPALATGFSRGLLVAAGVAVLALAAAAFIRPPAGAPGALPGPAPDAEKA